MPEIDPPPHHSDYVVKRVEIYKCAPSGTAMCGILWQDKKGTLFFEMVHGAVGDITDVNEIVKISRTRCVGTLVGGKLAERLWDSYVNRQRNSSATKIFSKEYEYGD